MDLSNLGSNESKLGSLNPYPDGSTWKELVGFDPKSYIDIDSSKQAKEIASLEILLRFEKRPLKQFNPPCYSAAENYAVSTTELLPQYACLDFSLLPVELQLQRWKC